MGLHDSPLTTTFLKGNYPSIREFTVWQDNKKSFTTYLMFSLVASFFLSSLLNFNSGSKLKTSFCVAVVLVFCLLVISMLIFTVKKETVLLVVPVAMQLTTTYLSGRQTVISIPWYQIGNLMILDVIVGQQVLCFLAVEVKKKDSEFKHLILFRHTRPRLMYLEEIYKELQRILNCSR